MQSCYVYPFPHAVRILHLLWIFTGFYQKGQKPRITAFWGGRVGSESRMRTSMEERAAGPTAALPDQEVLTNSPQGQLQGRERSTTFLPQSFLLKFSSCALLVLLLWKWHGKELLNTGPRLFQKSSSSSGQHVISLWVWKFHFVFCSTALQLRDFKLFLALFSCDSTAQRDKQYCSMIMLTCAAQRRVAAQATWGTVTQNTLAEWWTTRYL